MTIVPRAGSDLTGDWVSNFNWALSSSPLWKPLAPVIEDSILGWEAASVTPEFVIAGLGEQDFPNVLAGVFYGWLNSNCAYLAQLHQGSGRMLVSTFRFEHYGQDPFATLLLNQMLGSFAGADFGASPGLQSGSGFSNPRGHDDAIAIQRHPHPLHDSQRLCY